MDPMFTRVDRFQMGELKSINFYKPLVLNEIIVLQLFKIFKFSTNQTALKIEMTWEWDDLQRDMVLFLVA
jgi:hypothetical protein